MLAAFALLAVAGISLFPPEREVGSLIACFVVLNAGLMAICWIKDEPPGRGGSR